VHLDMARAAGFGLATAHGDDAILQVYVSPGETGAFCGAYASKSADGDIAAQVCEVCAAVCAFGCRQFSSGGYFGRSGRPAGSKESAQVVRRQGGDFSLMYALEFQRRDGVLHVDHAALYGICE